MEGLLVVLPLVGLTLPIVMVAGALVFDAAIIVWAFAVTAMDAWPRMRHPQITLRRILPH